MEREHGTHRQVQVTEREGEERFLSTWSCVFQAWKEAGAYSESPANFPHFHGLALAPLPGQ